VSLFVAVFVRHFSNKNMLKSRSEEFIGQTVEVLEKVSKNQPKNFQEEILKSITVVFPKENYKIGDFVNVKVLS
jgi:tRNA-2-methylthio-N6-dimethylallyladenosine synthase